MFLEHEGFVIDFLAISAEKKENDAKKRDKTHQEPISPVSCIFDKKEDKESACKEEIENAFASHTLQTHSAARRNDQKTAKRNLDESNKDDQG